MSDIIYLITLAGSFLALTVAIVITVNSRARAASLFLSAYLLCIAIALLEPLLVKAGVVAEGSVTATLMGGYTFLLGPLLYLYCKYQSSPAAGGIRPSGYWHFAPFMMYVALVLTTQDTSGVLEVVVYELFILHVVGYSVLSLRYVRRNAVHAHIAKDTVLRIRESFLRTFATLSVIVFVLIAVVSNTGLFMHWILPVAIGSAIQVIFVLYVLVIVFLTTELLVNQKFTQQ